MTDYRHFILQDCEDDLVNTFSGYDACLELLEDTAYWWLVPAMQTIEILL
jgi:hypothetical protein